ncbi:hypothetical protein DW322_11170 [Rhodococcus rhodnii]|nr:hypothetical protein DW322_11170 [Rhodococcus rhodnii]
MLHPRFFKSKPLAELSLAAERTFEAFWCYGDDRGRLEDDPAEIWAEAWMTRRRDASIDDVAGHLDALVDGGQLCRYEIGGGRFLHVIAWDEHQKISHPTPSKLPPCPDHHPLEWSIWWKDDDTATDRWRRAEKAARQEKRDSGETPENLARNSGATPPQCSSVQLSSDQANLARDSGENGNVRQFIRKSTGKAVGE